MARVFPAFVAVQAVLAGATQLGSAPTLLSQGRNARQLPLRPALDPESHDHFFKKDYPHDFQPEGAPHVHPQPGVLYPHFQTDLDSDKDYVKDENGDGGEWEAQMEYDRLRVGMKGLKNRAAEAEEQAKEHKERLEELKKKAAEARARADAARAEADTARAAHAAAEDQAKQIGVSEAEAKVRKEESDFAECQKQLEEVKAAYAKMLAEAEARKKALEAKGAEAAQRAEADTNAAKKEVDSTKAAGVPDYDAEIKALQEKEMAIQKRIQAEKEAGDEAKKAYHMTQAEIEQAQSELEEIAAQIRARRGYGDDSGGVHSSQARHNAFHLSEAPKVTDPVSPSDLRKSAAALQRSDFVTSVLVALLATRAAVL